MTKSEEINEETKVPTKEINYEKAYEECLTELKRYHTLTAELRTEIYKLGRVIASMVGDK